MILTELNPRFVGTEKGFTIKIIILFQSVMVLEYVLIVLVVAEVRPLFRSPTH